EGLASQRRMLIGDLPQAPIEYRCGGLLRRLHLGQGQKTGAYVDQQDNVARIAQYASGARVLDAFAYTGGFALAALRAGARNATLVDSSADALERAAADAAANGLSALDCIEGDVFDVLRDLADRGE